MHRQDRDAQFTGGISPAVTVGVGIASSGPAPSSVMTWRWPSLFVACMRKVRTRLVSRIGRMLVYLWGAPSLTV